MAARNVYNDTKMRVSASRLKARGRYNIQLTNITTGASTNFKANSIGGKLQKTVAFKGSGVTKTVIKDAEGRVVKQMASVGTAEIDCCIAKLVHDAINCTCKCNKCNEDLKRAETIYLLLQSAKHQAHTLGNLDQANEKVLKAKELCTEVCACGC